MAATPATAAPFRLRPVFALLIAVVLGILIGPALPIPPIFLGIAAGLLWVSVLAFPQRHPLLALALLSSVFLLFGAARARNATVPDANDVAALAAGKPSLWVEGVVDSEPETLPRGALMLNLQVRAIDDFRTVQPATGGLRLIIAQPDEDVPAPLPGDTLWARGRVEEPSGVRNPDGFDERAFLARRGIHATLVARRTADVRSDADAPGTLNWLSRLAHNLRAATLDALRSHLSPPDAALMGGILLSARSGLPADLTEALTRCGALYILSVSGLHLAALTGAIALLLTRVGGVPRRIANPIALAILWLIVLASGAQMPALRAGITLTILLLAPLVRRSPEPIHSLAVAALILLLAAPLTLFDPGAQIAFATIAALLLYLPPLEALVLPPFEYGSSHSLLRSLLRALPSMVLASVIAQLACTPLIAYDFNQVSFIAPLATVVLAPLSVLLLFTGVLAVAASGLPAFAFAPLWALNHGLLALLRGLALALAAPTCAAVPTVAPPLALVLLVYAFGFGLAPSVRRYTFRKRPFAHR